MSASEHHVKPQVVEAELADGAALLDLDAGVYYKLNTTALLVWRALVGRRRNSEIVFEICSKFSVSAEQCGRDVENIIGKLAELGLIHADTEEN